MRRKVLMIIAVAAAGMLLLTACTSSDEANKKTAGSKSGTGTSSGALAGMSDQQGTTGAQSPNTAQQEEGSQNGSAVQSADNTPVSDGTEDIQAPAQAGEPDDQGPVGDVIPDEDAQAAKVENQMDPDGDADDLWTGTYVGDEETVTITQTSDTEIQFSFAQSGISGTAKLNGYQAVYNGDDYYVVVFNLDDTVVNVSVSSEEDYDASGSPLIGTYVKAE